jgi:hypothetical protein
MTADSLPVPELSLDERKFQEETKAKRRELDLREREVAAKEIELRRSKWSPTLYALIGATLGLLANVWVAKLNNDASQQLEKSRNQSNLLLQAIKTDQTGACTNLLFLVKLKLLNDPDKTISNTCINNPKEAPSLPAESPRIRPSEKIEPPAATIPPKNVNQTSNRALLNKIGNAARALIQSMNAQQETEFEKINAKNLIERDKRAAEYELNEKLDHDSAMAKALMETANTLPERDIAISRIVTAHFTGIEELADTAKNNPSGSIPARLATDLVGLRNACEVPGFHDVSFCTEALNRVISDTM